MAREDVKVDVCLETVFTDFSYEYRIRKIAELGYRTPFFSRALQAGYKGWFGLEYFPKQESHDSLKQQLAMIEMAGSVK